MIYPTETELREMYCHHDPEISRYARDLLRKLYP
jgi:hypothetical protein